MRLHERRSDAIIRCRAMRHDAPREAAGAAGRVKVMAEYAQRAAKSRNATEASTPASLLPARSFTPDAAQGTPGSSMRPDVLQTALNRSPRVRGLAAMQRTINQNPRVQALVRKTAALGPPPVAQPRDIDHAWGGGTRGRQLSGEDARTKAAPAQFLLNRAELEPLQRQPARSTRPSQPPKIRTAVIQGVWATVKDSGEKLQLRTLQGQTSADGNQLYGHGSDEPAYEWDDEDMDGNITVTPYVGSKNPLKEEYEGWSADKTTLEPMDTPFGKASARHSRGAPFAQTNKDDYGGFGVGDSYQAMIYGLRGNSKDTSEDSTLAKALLEFSAVDLADEVQKNAASKLTVTVYLAEQWRKQGAKKIWRALLRLVKDGTIDFDKARQLFKFVKSADAGREQVGRFQDVHEGKRKRNDLNKDERLIYDAFSEIESEDFSSDDELRETKKLKSKSRLYAKKHQESESDDDSG
jgi:hypothetical protein